MRGSLLIAALLLCGCPKNEMRLMAAVSVLEMQVEQKQHTLAMATGRAEADAGVGIRVLPMAPPEIPEKSIFEGTEAGMLRARIVNLQAENARLDAMIAMLEAAQADGGAQ
ncbi:MAG: hypothetical protein QM723_38160 [Myxococcaceae bacterium]